MNSPKDLWEELEELETEFDQLLSEGRDVPVKLLFRITELEDQLYGDDLPDVYRLREGDV